MATRDTIASHLHTAHQGGAAGLREAVREVYQELRNHLNVDPLSRLMTCHLKPIFSDGFPDILF